MIKNEVPNNEQGADAFAPVVSDADPGELAEEAERRLPPPGPSGPLTPDRLLRCPTCHGGGWVPTASTGPVRCTADRCKGGKIEITAQERLGLIAELGADLPHGSASFAFDLGANDEAYHFLVGLGFPARVSIHGDPLTAYESTAGKIGILTVRAMRYPTRAPTPEELERLRTEAAPVALVEP